MMRLENLLSQHPQPREIDYSKFTDTELHRLIELLEDTEYDFLNQQEQQEIDTITQKAMER